MKNGWILILAILAIISLLMLTSCAECKTGLDCPRVEEADAFCYDGRCVYEEKAPGCGNNWCESNENYCSCPADCAKETCEGEVGEYFEKACYQKECVVDVASQQSKTHTTTTKNAGEGFRVNLEFNEPFNIKSDSLKLELLLEAASENVVDKQIQRLKLTGDIGKQEVVLGELDVNKPLWSVGKDFALKEELIISSDSKQAEADNIKLIVDYSYKTTRGDIKQDSLLFKLKEVKLILLKPSISYSCPKPCPKKQGHDSICNELTGRCEFKPMQEVIGNYKCEAEENKCTAPIDCGQCEKMLKFVQFSCVQNECTGQLRSAPEQISIFDDNKRAGFRLHNTYDYNNPFNPKEDKVKLTFTLFERDDDVSRINIDKIILLESNQQLALSEPKVTLNLANDKQIVELLLPLISADEEDKTLTLKVYYSYTKHGKKQTGEYTKTLTKTTLVNLS